MTTLGHMFLIGTPTECNIIRETCQVIWNVLSPDFLKPPTADEWGKISKDFYEIWNLPNCIGAVDGKHVPIKCPDNSGTLYYNYKGTYSILLMAMCDAKYNFIFADTGGYGSQSDGGVFKRSNFGKEFETNQLNVPGNNILPNTHQLFPFYIAADEAFPLKKFIMRPFPGKHLDINQKIFNYRLSRGRRIIENTFGILCQRWQILLKKLKYKNDTATALVSATIALHNFLNKTNLNKKPVFEYPSDFVDSYDENGNLQFGSWRNTDFLKNFDTAFRAPEDVKSLRKLLCQYFNSSAGEVSWQERIVTRSR